MYRMYVDGRVVAWTLPDGSEAEGISAKPTQRMIINAHSRSAVSALLTTPWGALWTGGKGGSLRWFPTAMREARAATGAAYDISEVPNCELRRHTGERAHARVLNMQLTASGQVWSNPVFFILLGSNPEMRRTIQ